MRDYIEQAVKTESLQWQEPNHRLLHAAMGLSTEGAELIAYTDKQNLVEELGDVLWYVALACDELEITMDEAEEASIGSDEKGITALENLILAANEILDEMKKSTFYGRKIDLPKVVKNLGLVISAVAEIADEEAMTFLDEIMEANIEKLRKRFSEGTFTQEEALNRDVCSELNHI